MHRRNDKDDTKEIKTPINIESERKTKREKKNIKSEKG